MVEKTLYIPQINCGHCIASIKNELTDIPGTEFVSADVVQKHVVVRYEDEQTLEVIKKTLIDIGFFPVD